ncbi:MAG: DUF58 domain-containing protein, partial [Planctomycetota bacterium]
GNPSKLRYAKQLAAALGFIGLCRADRVRIESFGSTAASRGPVLRGRQSLWRMTDYLDQLEGGDNVSLMEGVKNFALRNSGKGILVLISDLMDKNGYEQAFRYLVAQQLDVYVIQVLSDEEIHPDITGDLKLVDCEDEDIAEVTASRPLLDRYERTLAAFVDGAREFCTRRGMSYILASTEVPVDQMVGSYLRQRGLVR